MKISKIILFFLLCNVSINAQVGGERVYEFLNIATSARQIALGGKVLTLIDDVNQPLWNPSVINANLDNQLAVNYTSYLAGISIGSVSYSKMISRHFGTMHAGITYLNYGTLIAADENGNETGTFNASDVALSVGYAYNFPRTNFYMGANVKIVNATIANFSSMGVAADVGILYQNPYQPFVITLVVRNIGTQIKSFNGVIERLPLDVALGGSYQLEHVPLKWYVTMDNLQQWNISVSNPSSQETDIDGNTTKESISFLNNAKRHFSVGAELFPESAINLRVGYNFRKAAELQLQNVRTFGGISFGFGLKMNTFKLNYAYSKIHTASNVSTFSLQIDLDKK